MNVLTTLIILCLTVAPVIIVTMDGMISVTVDFLDNFQSMNILVTFLISTSSNASALSVLLYAPFQNPISLPASRDYPPANLPEGPYQHSLTVLSHKMFNGVSIVITPSNTSQWVAINRIIFCSATTEGL